MFNNRSNSPFVHARESSSHRWLRRAVTFPLIFLAWSFYLSFLPFLIILAIGWDLATRDLRFPRLRGVAFFGLYLTAEVMGLVVAFLIWCKWRLDLDSSWEEFLEDNFLLQKWWLTSLFEGTCFLYTLHREVEGEEVWQEEKPVLLFPRHSSTADTVIPGALVTRPYGFRFRYILKRELLWDPCLDTAGNRLPNYFIDRWSRDKEREIEGIAQMSRDLNLKEGVLLYPEGTRFSPEKLPWAKEKLSRTHPELASLVEGLENVLPPRLAGPVGLLEAAPHCDLVFMAHTGLGEAPNFKQLWSGDLIGQKVRVKFWRIPSSEIPEDKARWLCEQWQKMDREVALLQEK